MQECRDCRCLIPKLELEAINTQLSKQSEIKETSTALGKISGDVKASFGLYKIGRMG